MRLWPFGNRESRAGFTSQVSDEVISRATYGGDPDANGLSAAAACTRFYTSAMALATVSPASLQPTLHPVALAAIGRMLASTGNYVADLTVSDTGQTMLLPTGDFEVAGLSPDPAQWAYELRYRVPSRSEPMRRRRPAAGVAHIRINELDTAPHLGRSPIAVAHLSGRYAARLERSLASDANTKVMHIIPTPDGTPAARVAALANSLRRTDGNIQFVETVAGGWGGGKLASPSRDFESRRVGPQLPQASVYATQLLWPQICAAYGIHAGMFLQDGTTAREAQRQAYLNTIIPLAGQVAHVLSDSLGVVISFDFSAAMFADIRARGQALKAMTGAGLDLPTALTIIGLGDVATTLPASPPATPASPPPPTSATNGTG